MKKNARLLVSLGLIVTAACPLLTGCSHSGTDTSMSSQEEKNFKGGPMPPEARKAMMEQQQQAQAKAAQAQASSSGKP